MPRWLRIIRGMVGTGLTFAAGVGAVSSMIGLVAMLVGKLTAISLLQEVGRFSVVAFLVGVAFSGVLAIAARKRSFDRLSLPFVTSLGVSVGFLYFLFISISGHKVWSVSLALFNLGLLLLLGGGAAAGTLLVARRAGRALNSGDEQRELAEGEIEIPINVRESEQASRL